MACVMHQTSWSVFWLLVGWLVVGGGGGVCLFYSNSFLPYRGVQELCFLILRANLDTAWL